jgi:methionine sulfoxide reductase heme-binding subunit
LVISLEFIPRLISFRKFKMTKQGLSTLKKHWLWLAVNGIGVVLTLRTVSMVADAPLLTGWMLFTNSPALRNIVLFSGKTGLILLVLSLACTPVARLLGWNAALQVRKSLGLWGFGFACFHSLFFLQGKPLFTDLSSERLWQIGQAMLGIVRYGSKAPYAEAGVYALILLLPLALTSNRLAMRRLSKHWKRLHRLVYLAVPVAVYHYWWRSISTFPVPPPPDYWQPILFAVVVGVLLIVRIPVVRRRLGKLFKRVYSRQVPPEPHRAQGVPFIDHAAMTPRLDRYGGCANSASMNGETTNSMAKETELRDSLLIREE